MKELYVHWRAYGGVDSEIVPSVIE